jgi:SYP7 family syntaxin
MIDPFEETASSAEASLARARLCYDRIRNSGYVKAEDVAVLASELQGADVELELLLDAMTALRSSNGRVNGGKVSLPAAILVARQRRVAAADDERKELSRGLARLEKTLHAPASGSVTGGAVRIPSIIETSTSLTTAVAEDQRKAREGRNENDEFIAAHLETQEEELAIQDKALDRLHHHVVQMRQSASEVQTEMAAQEDALQRLHAVSDMLLSRVAVANERVDVMLNSMSNKGKVCLIVVLCLIVGIMIAVEFF